MSNNKEPYELLQTKISPQQAELLDAICNVLGVNTYQIFQMFFYVLCKASAPMHELSPIIRKIMTMMETDAGWAEAFNMANPEKMDVAQVVLILQQPGKKGFGAVMVDKPFMSEARMTECVDDILERVAEVTMHGIYRRLRLLGARMECENLSDVLLTMIDAQSVIELEEENKVEMKGEPMFDDRGRPIKYGARTKAHGRRTPDSLAADGRIKQTAIRFDTDDSEAAEKEARR
jgi:hypothetical protein